MDQIQRNFYNFSLFRSAPTSANRRLHTQTQNRMELILISIQIFIIKTLSIFLYFLCPASLSLTIVCFILIFFHFLACPINFSFPPYFTIIFTSLLRCLFIQLVSLAGLPRPLINHARDQECHPKVPPTPFNYSSCFSWVEICIDYSQSPCPLHQSTILQMNFHHRYRELFTFLNLPTSSRFGCLAADPFFSSKQRYFVYNRSNQLMIYNKEIQMNKGIKRKRENDTYDEAKIGEERSDEKYISQLASRYQFHLKQQEARTNLQINSLIPMKILTKIENCLSTYWNKILSVTIRGPLTEKELFISLCKPYQKELEQPEQKSLMKFIDMLSQKPRIQDDLFQKKRIICIFYKKSCVLDFMKSLQKQFFMQLASLYDQLQWGLSVKLMEENDKSSVWAQKITQLACIKTFSENLEDSKKLSQITIRTLNTDLSASKTKESQGIVFHSQKSARIQRSVVLRGSEYPLLIPLWRGLVDEIIMFRPIPIDKATVHEINQVFGERQELQSEVESRVQASLKMKLPKNEADMDSVHKIQISQIKQRI